MNKQAQMKIQQMAFMLIAVTLFFALAGMFVLVILFSGLKQSGESLAEQNALLLASRIANSPEFSCGDAFGTSMINCVDFDKAMALKGNIKKYEGFWGLSGIEIVKIYPKSDSGVECTKDNYPGCGKISFFNGSSQTGVSNFVSLCTKGIANGQIYTKCEMGRIILSY